MEILYGQNLVNALRKIMDASEYRIWISVPYIGGLISIKKILGERWLNNQRIDFKIITDIENNSAIDSQTIATFYHRGEVKTLLGLHAKIYISDQSCLITSANLTNTAFTKRHEVGILLNQSKEAIKLFEELWEKAEDMNLETVSKIKKATTKSVEESDSRRLKQLWNLPSNENPVKINVKENQYIDYFRIVADFKNFETKYESTQRIWSNKPLFFEIDGLFNYLYHHAPEFLQKHIITIKYPLEN
ncbi:MAG: hypothetical protein IPG55_16675 [Saprospiraceae bacterium]|nr:hypothetical protein [Candidatus Defluviibacterium haderslevense]